MTLQHPNVFIQLCGHNRIISHLFGQMYIIPH